ncbi:MAG: hypothetical protein K9K64_09275 [Desulfohalobiaceae bacterium]|nr:hypothetical protein [Desulfohalobiaceae bacterium]
MPMTIKLNLQTVGLSDYEITAYLFLLQKHPVNGSQLSRNSGIPRARIYDVLRSLKEKGVVAESDEGLYVPLPPDELIKRLRLRHESELEVLQERFREASRESSYDYVWIMRGYAEVMAKAGEMVDTAADEVYIRVFPPEGRVLQEHLTRAEKRGVMVKYIAMQPLPLEFACQITHPGHETIQESLGGRTLDLVVDRQEVLGGLLEEGSEDMSPINWGRNNWLVTSTRDSLRHDFFHYFLYQTLELQRSLTKKEKDLYTYIMQDG